MPPIAVLAGGLATRMRPLTEQFPKALLKVAGEPFIAHQLRLFAREGITDVKLLVGYCWEQIELFVGNGSKFGVRVDYVADGPTLLGTGGAVRRAIDALGPEFLVTYCGSWLDGALCAGSRRFSCERPARSNVCSSAMRIAGTQVMSILRMASFGAIRRNFACRKCNILTGDSLC